MSSAGKYFLKIHLLRVFFDEFDVDVPLLFGGKVAPRGDNRCDTKPPICDRGQRARKLSKFCHLIRI